MTSDQRKDEIRRRLKIAKHPRRNAAVFSAENDHNPIILQDCPKCHGSGHVCRHFTPKGGGQGVSREECPDCGGEGITGEVERFFSNNEPERTADCDPEGRVKCPCCGWRFRNTDSNAWTGYRHLRCGQKIKLQFVTQEFTAVKESLDDMVRGDNGVPFEEFDHDFLKRHNLPPK